MAGSPKPSNEDQPLPPGFQTIEQLQNSPSDQIKGGKMVNVIGFAKDYQPPFKSKGSDHKCTFEVVDHSDYDSRGLKINIFWPLVKMPDVWNGDAILIRKAKLQMWSGSVSLLGNYATEIHVLQTKKIPEAISEAPKVPWQSYSYDLQNHRPTTVETSYVMWAKNHGGLDLLSDTEFNEKKDRAMKVKDKFSLLKDVKDTCYYNILGEVIRVYDGSSNTVTVYLSDYTANSKFYNHAWGEGGEALATTGDKYGYLRPFSKPKAAKDWPGPYGKMCIQITLFDEHAIYVRESVKVNQWVFMKNVHMKFGKTGGILEGDLHGDRGKILVSVMEQADDPDASVDEKWKKAVGRKLEYEQKFKKQKQDIQRLGDKRKVGGEEPAKLNSKMRRKAERAAGLKKGAAAETRVMTNLDLNENIKCAFPDQPTSSIAEILKPRKLLVKAVESNSPFTLCKYRAHVRVVDYFPHKIEDFAVGRRATEYDMLSDYSGGEDTDPEEDMRIFRNGKGFKKNVWEWRFALQVEDANKNGSKDRIWLIVDNLAAQGLLGLDDNATNLRADQKLLGELKEQLFKLWGDIEEQKTAMIAQQPAKAKTAAPPSSFDTEFLASSPPRKAGDMPDDSDSENEKPASKSSTHKPKSPVLKEHNSNAGTSVNLIKGLGDENLAMTLVPRNKAFTCCIKQYGVQVKEDESGKANAGNGKRWQRMFALFGTNIM